MNFDFPDKGDYSDKIKELSNLFRSVVKTGTTSIGSGIHELLIRPMCIMYASIENSIKKWHSEYTLQNLEKSSNTSVGPADEILSNYFITRKSGTEASAIITVYTSDKRVRIDSGSVFEVEGVQLRVPTTTYGEYLSVSEETDDGIVHVKAYKSGDYYCFPVTVVSDGFSDVIISEGAECRAVSYMPSVVRAMLSSALSGGSGPETDAEMVARAKTSVLSWIGSSATIHKILSESGIPVYSSASFDFRDPEMCRASSSTMYINTGSMIDTYVKTSNYPLSGIVSVGFSRNDSGDYIADITELVPAGVIYIKNVYNEEGSPVKFSVKWGSSSKYLSDEGARLSIYQTTVLTVPSTQAVTKATVEYMYMPHIRELHTHMTSKDNRILGWDILVKAAVPVILRINGRIHTQGADVSKVSDTIAKFINNTSIGINEINLADIQHAVMSSCGSLLASPVLITATNVGYDGSIGVSHSSSGVFEISTWAGFNAGSKFVCVESSGVRIES